MKLTEFYSPPAPSPGRYAPFRNATRPHLSMENIEIKKLTLTDINPLQKISRQTFFETFADRNTEANMNHYLAEEFSIKKLTAELKNPDSQFYCALLDGKLMGYVKLNVEQSQTEIKDNKTLEIERIYVLRECQGKKVGQLLYETAIRIATELNADFVWLGVWEENERAILFYKKNGFVAFDKHIFKLGSDEQTDLMMKRQLKEEQKTIAPSF